MTRVFLNSLKSKKQLKNLVAKNVVSVDFEDEKLKHFTITFDVGGSKLQDLTIIFETRTPRIFVSDPYKVSNA